jgi:hypothetical protein
LATPVEVDGGADLLNELARGDLFDAGPAVTAVLAEAACSAGPGADDCRLTIYRSPIYDTSGDVPRTRPKPE